MASIHTKSLIWKYYKVCSDDNKLALCLLCNTKISRGGEGRKATTTSLKNHIKNKHAEQYAMLTAVPSTRGSKNNGTITSADSNFLEVSSTSEKKQLTLKETAERNLFKSTEKIVNPLATNDNDQEMNMHKRKIDDTEYDNEVIVQNEVDQPDTDLIKVEPEIIQDPLSTSNISQQSKSRKRKIDDVKPENDVQIYKDEAVFNKLLRLIDKPNDDYQIFGDYVATEFRLLKSDKNKMLLRKKIQRAILEVSEMETVEDSCSSWDGTGS